MKKGNIILLVLFIIMCTLAYFKKRVNLTTTLTVQCSMSFLLSRSLYSTIRPAQY